MTQSLLTLNIIILWCNTMKTIKDYLLPCVLLAAFVSSAQAVENATVCVQAAQAALFTGKSPIQGFNFNNCRNGSSIGDPHLTTFSGLAYDHNFPGVYRLVELNGASDFSVLVRNVIDKAKAVSSYTITSALKVQWAAHSLELHRGKTAVLFIDGKKITLANNKTQKIGTDGTVSRKNSSYFITNPAADLAITVYAYETYLDLIVTAPNAAKTLGLLGNTIDLSLHENNGLEVLATDDATDPSLSKVNIQDLTRYVESWRVADSGLFSYGDIAQEPDYTAKIYTLADLSDKQLKSVTNKCKSIKGDSPTFNMKSCVFDLGFGGTVFSNSVKYHQPAFISLEVMN